MSINKNEFIDFLEDYLMEEEAKDLEIKITGEEEQDGPLIDSMQKANYFIKLVAKMKEDIEEMNLLCNGEIEKVTARINEYRDSMVQPLENQIAYYSKLLQNFAEKELEGSKKRSIKLPYGTLSMKKQQPKWEYGDEKELIKWLQENDLDDLLNKKETYSIDKKNLKEKVTINSDHGVSIDGKHIPNVDIIEQEDKFTIKI